MLIVPGTEIELAKTQLRRNQRFCQGVLLGKVTVQVLRGRESAAESWGRVGGEVRGIFFLLVCSGERGLLSMSRPLRAPRGSNQRSQGRSANPKSRDRAQIGREGADMELEQTSNGTRSQTGRGERPCPASPGLWLWWVSPSEAWEWFYWCRRLW